MLTLLPRIDAEALRSRPGRIELEYTDDAGDTAALSLAVGDGPGSCARVLMNDEELWSVLDSGMRVTSLVTSKLRIEGDAQYVLLVATSIDL